MKSATATQPGRPNRDSAMLIAYQNGATLAEIGAEFNLSKQRVHQILVAMACQMRRTGPRAWVQS